MTCNTWSCEHAQSGQPMPYTAECLTSTHAAFPPSYMPTLTQTLACILWVLPCRLMCIGLALLIRILQLRRVSHHHFHSLPPARNILRKSAFDFFPSPAGASPLASAEPLGGPLRSRWWEWCSGPLPSPAGAPLLPPICQLLSPEPLPRPLPPLLPPPKSPRPLKSPRPRNLPPAPYTRALDSTISLSA